MSRDSFRKALFCVIEKMLDTELRASSQDLILNYFNESAETTSLERARDAVERYTQKELPRPAELSERERAGTLTKLDRLVLAMNLEAERWDKTP